MADQAPNQPPADKPTDPPSAKEQPAPNQTPAASETPAAAAPATDEPATSEEALEEEQEEEVGHQDSDSDDKPEPLQPPEITQAAGESGRLPRRLGRRSMEYPIADMYPEMRLLVEQKRREWNYRDPDMIRALFLEAKTNVVAEWRIGRANFAKRKKPLLEIQENTASKLRRQQRETRLEKLQQEQQRAERILHHRQPDFAEVKLATNVTTQLRYNYIRNNPPVPRHFLAHYERFKRPPFHTNGGSAQGCHLDWRPNF